MTEDTRLRKLTDLLESKTMLLNSLKGDLKRKDLLEHRIVSLGIQRDKITQKMDRLQGILDTGPQTVLELEAECETLNAQIALLSNTDIIDKLHTVFDKCRDAGLMKDDASITALMDQVLSISNKEEPCETNE